MSTATDEQGADRMAYAAQIAMGHGKVDVAPVWHEGRVGMLLHPRDKALPVGQPGTDLTALNYWPGKGDVVIWLDGPEMGLTIIDCLLRLDPNKGDALAAAEARGAAIERERIAAWHEAERDAHVAGARDKDLPQILAEYHAAKVMAHVDALRFIRALPAVRPELTHGNERRHDV